LQGRVDVGQRGRAVLRRIALAEHVEVDAVQDEEVFMVRQGYRFGVEGECRQILTPNAQRSTLNL